MRYLFLSQYATLNLFNCTSPKIVKQNSLTQNRLLPLKLKKKLYEKNQNVKLKQSLRKF